MSVTEIRSVRLRIFSWRRCVWVSKFVSIVVLFENFRSYACDENLEFPYLDWIRLDWIWFGFFCSTCRFLF